MHIDNLVLFLGMEMTHLESLEIRLAHEIIRLAGATSEFEKKMRGVWVDGIKKEIRDEYKRLGSDYNGEYDHLSDDELLNELGI